MLILGCNASWIPWLQRRPGRAKVYGVRPPLVRAKLHVGGEPRSYPEPGLETLAAESPDTWAAT